MEKTLCDRCGSDRPGVIWGWMIVKRSGYSAAHLCGQCSPFLADFLDGKGVPPLVKEVDHDAHSALELLLKATEHLAYRQESGCYIQRRMDDGTLVPLDEWHHFEAVRLLAEARETLVKEATDE